jgi:hypothetical protein
MGVLCWFGEAVAVAVEDGGRECRGRVWLSRCCVLCSVWFEVEGETDVEAGVRSLVCLQQQQQQWA